MAALHRIASKAAQLLQRRMRIGSARKAGQAVKFEMHPSFYMASSNPNALRASAIGVLNAALKGSALSSGSRVKVNQLMRQRIELSLVLPHTQKQCNKLLKRMGKIDVRVFDLITESEGIGQAQRFAGLLRQHSERKIKPISRDRQQ